MTDPVRGEIWWADLSLTRGREQKGDRPVLVLSVDGLNRSRAGIVVVVPLTRTDRSYPSHVRVEPPDGGLEAPSFAMAEQIRAASKDRLRARMGRVSLAALAQIERAVRDTLGL